MPKLPVLKPREVVSVLGQLGFSEIRQRGSHKQFRHSDGRVTTVPFHAGETSLRIFCAKSLKTFGSRPKNSSSYCNRCGAARERFLISNSLIHA